MIYLASPYSHPDPTIRDARFEAVCLATAGLVRAGQPVFAPVMQGHPLVRYEIPSDWSFWEPLAARVCLARCDEVVVLQLEGWTESISDTWT